MLSGPNCCWMLQEKGSVQTKSEVLNMPSLSAGQRVSPHPCVCNTHFITCGENQTALLSSDLIITGIKYIDDIVELKLCSLDLSWCFCERSKSIHEQFEPAVTHLPTPASPSVAASCRMSFSSSSKLITSSFVCQRKCILVQPFCALNCRSGLEL